MPLYDQPAGSGVSPPAGDIGGTAGTPTVVATHLASALPVAQGGTNAGSAGAALTSLGAASASGLTTETSRATAAEAALLPLAGGTMSGAIAMGTSKITGVGNGSGAQDVAAFGQIPAALPPNGSAGGVLTGTYPNPGISTLNQNTSGTAAGLSATLAIGSGGTGQTGAAAAYNALSPMSTTGDLEYESGTNTAGRLAVGSTGQILTVVSGLPAWQSLDATAGDILPAGVQAAGTSTKAAAADHVHPGYANSTLYLAPAGATGETFPRRSASSVSNALVSGQLFVTAIPLPAGLAINNITMFTNTTVKTGGTHGWYVLLDSSRVVRAVTADQTDASTVWGVASTAYTLSVSASAYTTTYSGLYYIGVMVAETSGATPTFVTAQNPASGMAGPAPILSGGSSTSQTTPPALGATMTTITANGGFNLYAYTS